MIEITRLQEHAESEWSHEKKGEEPLSRPLITRLYLHRGLLVPVEGAYGS